MGGDQANGMALVIGACMVLIVLGAVALFAFAGRLLTRRASPPRRRLAALLMGLVGAGLGWLLVIATFYESTLWPPPRLSLATPSGFDAPVVILLEDPRAARTLEWRGGGLPFTAAAAEISVPPAGIVRLRSFGLLNGVVDLEAIWPDGSRSFGSGSGSGPPGSGANAYLLIARPDVPIPEGLQSTDPATLSAYVVQREGRR